MQIIIDIPDQMYDWVEHTGVVHNEDCGYLGGAILDGITIHEDATNGDVIKTLFPNVKSINGLEFVTFSLDTVVGSTVTKEWWNAPYRRGD